MVEPLLADLCAVAVAHGLLDEVALAVGEERVDPHEHVTGLLVLELGLTVDGPGEQPARVAARDDATGHHLARERISTADRANGVEDRRVGGVDGRAHPVGELGSGAEHVGVAEGAVRDLRGDPAPHVPAATGAELLVDLGRRVLVAEGRVLHAAAVRDVDLVVLGEVDALLVRHAGLVRALDDDGTRDLARRRVGRGGDDVELDVDDLAVVLDGGAGGLKVLDHGQNHRVVLVVLGEAKGSEVGKATDVVNVALQVALDLERGVPVLEGEHRAPVQPEVRVEDLVIPDLVDRLAVEALVGGQEELGDLLAGLVGESELLVGVGILAAVLRRTAE